MYEGTQGTLVYRSDAEGNRIPDFSYAGYRSGIEPLPDVPTVHRIDPVEGDNTLHIQQAIREVENRNPDASGFRGALELGPGVYLVSETIFVSRKGIVLRGVGDEADPLNNTIIKRTGTSTSTVIVLGNPQEIGFEEIRGSRRAIQSDTVYAGDRIVEVDDSDPFQPGDDVLIRQPLTPAWIDAIDGGGTASDPPWPTDEFTFTYPRKVLQKTDNFLLLDAPIFSHLIRSLAPGYVVERNTGNDITEVGIERLRIEIETSGPESEDHARSAVEFNNVFNGWAREITARRFVYAGIDVRSSQYVTVINSRALDPHSQITGGRRYNFAVSKSQLILFENNRASRGRHNYVGNGEALDAGIVFYNNISDSAFTSSEPHRKWGQAFLFDNHVERYSPRASRRIHLGNRGNYGTAHGWAGVHSVAWNCKMGGSAVVIEKPPLAQNYAIGCTDAFSILGPFRAAAGHVEGLNKEGLKPASLYKRQLSDRIERVSLGNAPHINPPDIDLSVYPNPSSTGAQISFYLKVPSVVTLHLYDITGKRIATPYAGALSPGPHALDVASEEWPAGVYLYQLLVAQPQRFEYSGMLVVGS